MNSSKDDILIKRIYLALLSLFFLAVVVFCIIKKDELRMGWHEDGDTKYYISFPLKRASGIKEINGADYLFSSYGDNELLYGWNKFDGDYYFSLEDGTIAKGQVTLMGKTYHFDSVTGKFHKNISMIVDGKLWYFGEYGEKVFGIVELNGEKYCFSENGNLKKGLQSIDGKTYYFDPKDENMLHDRFLTVNGSTYYFGSDGAAVVGEVVIDGFTYYFDESGRQISSPY